MNSTGSNMAFSYSAHGDTNVIVEDNILIIKSRGPWNIEYVHGLHQQLISVVENHNLSNYGVLLIPLGEAIGVHETMEYHVNFLRQGKAKAVAINLSQCETPHSTESMCRVAYQTANLEHEFFYSNEEAKLWLKNKMC